MNNCETCEHFAHKDGGHCYMFRVEPAGPCMQHTALRGVRKIPADVGLGTIKLSPEWQAVAVAIQKRAAPVVALPVDLWGRS